MFREIMQREAKDRLIARSAGTGTRTPTVPSLMSPPSARTPPSESPDDSFLHSLSAPVQDRPKKPRVIGTYASRKKAATDIRAYAAAVEKYSTTPCCKENCIEKLSAKQFMETRRLSYDRSSHERSEWLDSVLHGAKRAIPRPGATELTFEFSFTVGVEHPVQVCEEAFFTAADISGGSRTSAMSAVRKGIDRRHDRLLNIPRMRQAPKGDEMLGWQHRYLEYRGHYMPHMGHNDVFIDKERRATMYGMFQDYCTRQGILEDDVGGEKLFGDIWRRNFINREKDDPRGQVRTYRAHCHACTYSGP